MDPLGPAFSFSETEALLCGQSNLAPRCAPGTLLALAPSQGIETAPRHTVLAADFSGALPAGVLVIAACTDRRLLVEGIRRTERTESTFVASVTIDDEARVSRYVDYACDGVYPLPSSSTGPQDGLALASVVDKYFDQLDRADFDAAAECFSADVIYSHPPYRHTGINDGGRITFHGRSTLREAFERRGPTSFDHVVDVVAQNGSVGLIEGRVLGLPNGAFGSFISSCHLDDEGKIKRYISFYCEPGVDDDRTPR